MRNRSRRQGRPLALNHKYWFKTLQAEMSTNSNLFRDKASSPRWTLSPCLSQEKRQQPPTRQDRFLHRLPYHWDWPHLDQGSSNLRNHQTLIWVAQLAETSKVLEQLISVITRILSPCQDSSGVRMDRVSRVELPLVSKKPISSRCSHLKRNCLL